MGNLLPKNEPVKLWAVSESLTATGLLKTPPTSTTKSSWSIHNTKSSDEMPICNGSPNQSTNTENAKAHQRRQKIPRCWQRTPIHPNHRWFPTRCLEKTKHPATPTKEVNSTKNLVKLLKILRNFNILFSKNLINLLCCSCHLRSKVTQKNKIST